MGIRRYYRVNGQAEVGGYHLGKGTLNSHERPGTLSFFSDPLWRRALTVRNGRLLNEDK
jgi:hypothetical protein